MHVSYVTLAKEMKFFAYVFLLFTVIGAFASEPGRQLSIRGWEFEVPAFLAQSIHEGPDFTVTYLSAKEKKMGMGIYEGGYPQEIARDRPSVRHEKENIGGQITSWALWEEGQDVDRLFRFEVFILIRPEDKESDKFQLFGYASSSSDLDLLRAVVRSGHHQVKAVSAGSGK